MFKARLVLPTLAAAILCSAAALAQAPAGAPAGANGTCKDGTYSMNATKSGACAGHKGVATWYGPAAAPKTAAAAAKPAATPMPAPAAKPAPVTAAKPAPMATPAPAPAPAAKPAAPAPAAKSASTKTVAPGGGPGMVWVNTSSNIYHCPATADYGTTKAGKYVSESAAMSSGAKIAGKDKTKKCF